jgi:membrane-bound ClpP family serine protease
MSTATPNSLHLPSQPRRAHPGWLPWTGALLLLALGSASVRAQDPPDSAYLPITGTRMAEATHQLRQIIDTTLKKFEDSARQRPGGTFKLLCDFNPEGLPSASTQFGASYDLAKTLRSLRDRDVRVIGYVHGDVSKHSVLPVLACTEIVMSTDPVAHLGRVADKDRPLDATERNAYREFAQGRFPLALIEKMFDSNMIVIRVKPTVKEGDRYRSDDERPRPDGEPVPDLGRGVVANYTFEQALNYGLLQTQREPLNSLKAALAQYELPASILYQMPDHPNVWKKVLTGPIDGGMKERIERFVRRARGQKANVLLFQLECSDGSSNTAYEIGRFLARLNENRAGSPVVTIAYVTPKASNNAAFLALGCSKIVMQPGAKLGQFDSYLSGNPSVEISIRKNLADLADTRHHSEVLARGLADRSLRIRWVTSARGNNLRTFLDEDTYQKEKNSWLSLEVVKPAREEDAGRYLTLDHLTALRLGLAAAVKEPADSWLDITGVDAADIHEDKDDMLDDLADFLRNPWTRLVLIMVGIACLILELKMPGVTLPGVIAAVCFVLYFWSHSQLNNQITWLALLLFLLGLALIALEVFVIPGFGVTGISGILLVLGSLALVAYGHWPQSSEDWAGLGQQVGPIGIGMLLAICLAFLLARYLPSVPLFNRLMLHPPDETADGLEQGPGVSYPELAALLGAIGVAATPLRPAGKTKFGEEFVDVVAEGSYIEAGTRVQVIEVEGNRVVVKEV